MNGKETPSFEPDHPSLPVTQSDDDHRFFRHPNLTPPLAPSAPIDDEVADLDSKNPRKDDQ
ncbi:MAG TPA: hypothetical protein VGU72_25480 [Beijerinckiaceae bacterium]|jgi:hypothetical protein|nr:hypothetical protein [Beijerinckiaceae bacterium]